MGHSRSRRALLEGLCAASVAGIAGCTGERRERRKPPSGDSTVRMTGDGTFVPERTTISVGETVVWVNDGLPMQSVTANEEEIPSLQAYFASGGFKREISARIAYPLKGNIKHGEWYSHTFGRPGTYGYVSIPSESRGMTGTVVVTEE